MKSVYIFSGLGVDERIFQFMDFSGFNITHVKWLLPDADETIENYAKRLSQSIITKQPVLIGLSFGGIMATEVAKLIGTEKIILIASAKTRGEIPFYYKFAGKLKLHKLIPVSLLKRPTAFNNWLFGTSNGIEKQLLTDILYDTDPEFLKWAIEKVVTWKNNIKHKNMIHIHGTADRILPIRYVNCDIKVENGSHFMTVSKAHELSELIKMKSH